MRMLRICSWLICASFAACTTPPEIKQALAAKDQAYAENEQLMQQYRELVGNITTRHQQWYRFVQTRLKLNLALQWATTNPRLWTFRIPPSLKTMPSCSAPKSSQQSMRSASNPFRNAKGRTDKLSSWLAQAT